jgi:hypothetical protein
MTFPSAHFARGKHVLAAVVVAAFGFCAAPASAACISSATVFCDTTVSQSYNGNAAYNYNGPGFTNGIGDVLQDPGHGFNTDRLVASLTKSRHTTTLHLSYYTTFNGNDLTARYADIFLGNTANPDSLGYGISVGDEAANGGLNTVGFYQLTGASSYKNSTQIWASKTSYIYGGKYKGFDNQFHLAPVVITNSATQNNAFTAVTHLGVASGDPTYPYRVDVTLSASNQDFNALFGNALSVFWGTGDCSNDAIIARLSPIPRIPEPMTLAIFGTGLALAAIMLRRRKSKKG